jgi:hypothetical protein
VKQHGDLDRRRRLLERTIGLGGAGGISAPTAVGAEDDGSDGPAGPNGILAAVTSFTSCAVSTPVEGAEPLQCGAIDCVLDAPGDVVPNTMSFAGVSPNPVLGSGVFRFAIPRTGTVRLELIDQQGRRVIELMNTSLGAGTYTAAWDGRLVGGNRAAPGLYFARFQFDGRTLVRRVVMLH